MPPARATAAGRGRALAHDVRQDLRRVWPVVLIGLVAFAVLLPVSTAALSKSSIFNLDFTHDQLKFRLFAVRPRALRRRSRP